MAAGASLGRAWRRLGRIPFLAGLRAWRRARISGPLPHPLALLGAAGLNGVLIVLLGLAWSRPVPLRGDPEGTAPVPVMLIPSRSLDAVLGDPDPASATAPVPAPTDGPAPSPVAERDAAQAAESSRPRRGPGVDLPDTEHARGTASGLIGLACAEVFSDPQKARECAGDEIRSGWRPGVEGEGRDPLGPDWAKVAEDLRRGGQPRVFTGPDRYGNLAPGEEVFAAPDPRFEPNLQGQLGKYNEAFTSAEELAAFRAMQDPRTYVPLNEGSVPLSGWRPSWMLRDTPAGLPPGEPE
jgi:hypothetical protein